MKLKAITLTILAAATTLSQAAFTTISFLTDTWNYTSGPSTTGFVNQTPATTATPSSGSVTKDGVTMKFSASFVGTAVSGANFGAPNNTVGSSMTNATAAGLNPPGFLLSTQTNDSPGLTEGIAAAPTTGTVTSFQRWHFEFSAPVILNTFIMEDIDNLNGSFRDILGAEAFTSITAGVTPTAGTGFDPTYTPGTSLEQNSLTVGTQNLLALYPKVDTANPASTPPVNASVAFGATPIRAFSIYAISNMPGVHRMALDGSQFIVVVPEPSSAALGLLAVGGFFLRRRR